jgi:hypothetical protein
MKQVAIVYWLALPTLLAGCASNFYTPTPGAHTAKVRFIAIGNGNTEFDKADSAECKTKLSGMLGWFHPAGSQSFQADRRGFNRRVGMPDGDKYPSHMYSELEVDADPPFFVSVSSTAQRGVYLGDVGVCVQAVQLPVRPNRMYELIHERQDERCQLFFFELTQESGHLERKAIEPTQRSPVCTGLGIPKS